MGMSLYTLPEFVDDPSTQVEDIVGHMRVVAARDERNGRFVPKKDVGRQQVFHDDVEDAGLELAPLFPARLLRRSL